MAHTLRHNLHVAQHMQQRCKQYLRPPNTQGGAQCPVLAGAQRLSILARSSPCKRCALGEPCVLQLSLHGPHFMPGTTHLLCTRHAPSAMPHPALQMQPPSLGLGMVASAKSFTAGALPKAAFDISSVVRGIRGEAQGVAVMCWVP